MPFRIFLKTGRQMLSRTERKRRPAQRLEFAPTRFLGTVRLKTTEDYAALLPPDLPDTFTARELIKALGLPESQSSAAAGVLCHMGAIRRGGTRGKAYLYTIS